MWSQSQTNSFIQTRFIFDENVIRPRFSPKEQICAEQLGDSMSSSQTVKLCCIFNTLEFSWFLFWDNKYGYEQNPAVQLFHVAQKRFTSTEQDLCVYFLVPPTDPLNHWADKTVVMWLMVMDSGSLGFFCVKKETELKLKRTRFTNSSINSE